MAIAELLAGVLGGELPIEVRAYDGSRVGTGRRAGRARRCGRRTRSGAWSPRPASSASGVPTSPAISMSKAISSRSCRCTERLDGLHLSPPTVRVARCKLVGVAALRPLPPPPEEARLRGRPHTARARCRGDLVPLRHVERVLRAPPGSVAHLLVRGVVVADDRSGSRAGRQARARVPEAGARTRDASARRRLRLGEHAPARGAAPRRPRRRRHAVARAGRARRQASRGGRPLRLRRDPASRTTATSRDGPVRRDQLDRHVRARRSLAARGVLRGAARAAPPRGSAAEPRHQPCTRIPRQAASVGRAASSTPTCSPTASSTRWARSSAPSRSAGSRSGTWRACASTTRSRCGRGSPTSRRTGTPRSR